MIDAIPANNSGGNAQFDHLMHERLITCELIRVIGEAPTWSDATEAALALVHIRRMAKSMRAESEAQKNIAMQNMQQNQAQAKPIDWSSAKGHNTSWMNS